ncbi:MAG: DUF3667 domain-containing protein [Woeseiaceae bacterium]|nr:DUF3667 domain-containing protein [Woeseiaceae bacterium]
MKSRPGPIYEVSCFVDAQDAAAFANALDQTVRVALERPDIVDVRVHERPGGGDDPNRWLIEYVLAEDADVDNLVASGVLPAAGDGESVFGTTARFGTRLLGELPDQGPTPAPRPDCLNCGTPLSGQYCGECGQRARSRLISLWELVTDAFGDLFELDSRLWRTLIPLVVRPGRLTDEYLKGRRVRFMPPFRMYLVLSLVFFLVAFTDPREKLGILFEAPAEAVAPQNGPDAPAGADPTAAEKLRQEILADLERGAPDPAGDDAPPGLNIELDPGGTGEIRCDLNDADLEELPDFLARRLTVERMERVCEQLKLDDGRAFADGVINAIPTALIVLLPVLAFVLAALYPLSRRYYVEHLLFLVHFHAFFFLLLTLQILFARAATWAGLPEAARVLTLVATSLYVPVYLFLAMRRVYGQGRFVTFLKFLVLTLAYLAGFTMTMLSVAIVVAFSL